MVFNDELKTGRCYDVNDLNIKSICSALLPRWKSSCCCVTEGTLSVKIGWFAGLFGGKSKTLSCSGPAATQNKKKGALKN